MLFIMIAGYSPFDAPEVGSSAWPRSCEVTQIYKNIIKVFPRLSSRPSSRLRLAPSGPSSRLHVPS